MRQLLWLAVLAVAVNVPLCGTCATIHVPDDQPTIQAGIVAASHGDTVLVACGTYYEHDIDMKSGVYLTSETGLADCVTVDAQQQGRVFYCGSMDGLASIVGFTITGGLVTGPYPNSCGGGMYCYDSSPTLTSCTFCGNQAEHDGGGMYCYDSSPTLTDCTFSGNQAGYGGGMFCYVYSSAALTDCTFLGNQAVGGGGMYCYDYSSATLTDCTFSGNQAGYAGGMFCYYASISLTNCAFSGNEATGPDAHGGGIYIGQCSPLLRDCTFSGNQAGYGGGMFCSSQAYPTLTGCTFSGNQAAAYAGGIDCCYSSSPTLTGCIVAFSTQGEAIHCFDEDSTPLLVCCDVYGNAGGDWVGCLADQYGVNGNFSEDPLFCDTVNDDFTLAANSPCLPGGNDCGVLVGAYGEGCPGSPVEISSWGAIKAMFR